MDLRHREVRSDPDKRLISWIASSFLLANRDSTMRSESMTRSDDEKCRPLAVNEIADQVRNDGRGCEYRVKRFPFGEWN